MKKKYWNSNAEREEKKGEREGRQETAELMHYLWNHGRVEDAMRASKDLSWRSC